jgi:hypothetical protein
LGNAVRQHLEQSQRVLPWRRPRPGIPLRKPRSTVLYQATCGYWPGALSSLTRTSRFWQPLGGATSAVNRSRARWQSLWPPKSPTSSRGD